MNIAWKRVEPTVIQRVGWRELVVKTFLQPNGKIHEYTTIGKEHSHCIATVALTKDNQVIVARQYRPGPEMILDELPGGGADEGEDFMEAAKRELLEETGYETKDMIHLGDTPKDAYTNSMWHFFLATGCTPHPEGQQLDSTEFIEIRLISILELIENACAGRMTDAPAVLMAYEKLRQIEESKK